MVLVFGWVDPGVRVYGDTGLSWGFSGAGVGGGSGGRVVGIWNLDTWVRNRSFVMVLPIGFSECGRYRASLGV